MINFLCFEERIESLLDENDYNTMHTKRHFFLKFRRNMEQKSYTYNSRICVCIFLICFIKATTITQKKYFG